MRTSLELLKLLKEEYNKNAVSVLIGSGFSKNANPNYMNWDELLFDLVVFLYEEKIRNKYNFHNRSPTQTDLSFSHAIHSG